MATPAQIRANRANAQRATGPRTEAGCEITKRNALKHGLAAQELVIPGEDPAALDALRAELISQYEPANPTENLLVDDLATCFWRLVRARKYESQIISREPLTVHAFTGDTLAGIQRYTASAERGRDRALAQLRIAQNDRRKREQEQPPAAASAQEPETEKVMAVGSVLQNDAVEPGASPEVPSELTTGSCQPTTAVRSVLQHEPEPTEPAAELSTEPAAEIPVYTSVPFTAAQEERAARYAKIQEFVEFAKSDMARMRR